MRVTTGWSLNRFIWTSVAAALVAAIGVAYLNLGLDDHAIQAAGFFALLCALTNLLAYSRGKHTTASVTFVPLLSAVAIAPGLSTMLACTLAIVLGEVVQQRGWPKAIFNVAQHSVAISVAVLTFYALGGVPLPATGLFIWLPFVGAYVTFFAVNTILVSGIMGILQRQPLLWVWRRSVRGAFLYDLIALPLVYVFACVYTRFDAGWCAALALPLVGVRQIYAMHWQMAQTHEEFLQLMVATIDARDPYTSGHSQRVSEYVQIVARILGLSDRAVERLTMAALLHDVGKIHEEFAPILKKTERLTDEEYALIQTHPAKGAALVGKVSHLHDIVASVRGHHEGWDGKGYPDQLVGTAIPLWSRVIALADTIDAMTIDRPYRPGKDAAAARAEVIRCAGRQFDPTIATRVTADDHWAVVAEAIERNRVAHRATQLAAANQRPAASHTHGSDARGLSDATPDLAGAVS